MKRGAWVLVPCLLLSGCAGTTTDVASQEGGAPAETAVVSETLGAIRGLVVDASFSPAVNATVALMEVAATPKDLRTTTTDAAGRFVFALVSPNEYRVEARAPGFATTGRFLKVFDGEVSEVQLTLTDVATNEPYIALLPKVGMINCGFAVVMWAAFCGGDTLAAVVGKNNAQLNFSIPVGHRAVIVETDWTANDQTMHQWFYADAQITKWLGDSMSRPTLRKEFYPDRKASSFRVVATNHVPFPSSETPVALQVWTFYDGANQQTFNQTGGPACQFAVQGYCAGVGLAIQFRFQQYVSVFVHEVPAEVAKYSAVPDR